LKNTGVQFLDFRDNWVAVEDQHVEMRQSSDSDLEMSQIWTREEEVQRKRKRQGNNRKNNKEDDNIHEMEIQALRALEKHKFKFRVQRDDKEGATVVISESH